ncbi:hypothetical protein, partial [Schleiferilactobacillus harbinensis]|uniref:hypothetical protein n=1 Tax=Schleiferilactobacillus harbinensis TaxID=304207 RepID=UPI0021A94DC1
RQYSINELNLVFQRVTDSLPPHKKTPFWENRPLIIWSVHPEGSVPQGPVFYFAWISLPMLDTKHLAGLPLV